MSRLPFELSVAKPCQEQWSAMTGTSSARHCRACNKAVHNLATMTPREIKRLILETSGNLCARITHTASGEVQTAAEPAGFGLASGFVLATALAAVPAGGQEQAKPDAIVSGTVMTPKNNEHISSTSPREVLFIQDEKAVLTVTTDSSGHFTATLPAGRYDVVFRSGVLFGERVKNADLHQGHQEFSAVRERFAYGHLTEKDQTTETFVTVGEVIGVPWYGFTPRNLLLHPVGVARTLLWQAKWRTRRLLHLSS